MAWSEVQWVGGGKVDGWKAVWILNEFGQGGFARGWPSIHLFAFTALMDRQGQWGNTTTGPA